MNRVYLLEHCVEMDLYHDDAKLIGVYTSEEEAKRVRDELLLKPGFKDYPDGFTISPCTIGRLCCETGFVSGLVEDFEGE